MGLIIGVKIGVMLVIGFLIGFKIELFIVVGILLIIKMLKWILIDNQIFINILIVYSIMILSSGFIRIREKIKRIDNQKEYKLGVEHLQKKCETKKDNET